MNTHINKVTIKMAKTSKTNLPVVDRIRMMALSHGNEESPQ